MIKFTFLALVWFALFTQLVAFYRTSGIKRRQFGLKLIACPEGNSYKKRIVSAVQPSGNLHIGNYFGAIKRWTQCQDDYDCFFSIADLHAITSGHDQRVLHQYTLQTAAWYIACGIDPKRSKIFVQSHVKGHCELAWLLNCVTPMTWLQSMIQYKEKSKKLGSNIVSAGLFHYPVLMAADILLHKADFVPVGMDQQQHLNLARSIAHRFYHLFCPENQPVFPVPEIILDPHGCKIMSLEDGNVKMSKSAENDHSRINLNDSPNTIREKIQRAKTDSQLGLEMNNPDRPEANNLLRMYKAASGCSEEEIYYEYVKTPNSAFKPRLAEALIRHLQPIQDRYKDLISDTSYLNNVLAEGQEAADLVAEDTLKKVKDLMGFYPQQFKAEPKDMSADTPKHAFNFFK